MYIGVRSYYIENEQMLLLLLLFIYLYPKHRSEHVNICEVKQSVSYTTYNVTNVGFNYNYNMIAVSFVKLINKW